MSIELALLPIAIAAWGAYKSNKRSRTPSSHEIRVPTRMRDQAMLQQALENYGCGQVNITQVIETAQENCRIVFEPDDDGFVAVFTGPYTSGEPNEFVDNVFHEYTKLVQQGVYEKLKSQAESRGLILEHEQVEDDDSVVLTFTVHG